MSKLLIKFSDIVIVSATRTPIGKFGRSLSQVKAHILGAEVIKSLLYRSGLDKDHIDLIVMGQVIRAGSGMLTSKQAAITAGLPPTIDCLNVDMVCSSSMAAIATAALYIEKGAASLAIAGGFESMSQAPYILDSSFRRGVPHLTYRRVEIIDSMVYDGLTDPFNNYHMGKIADLYARKIGAGREELDLIALESHRRAAKARDNGVFSREITPISITLNGKRIELENDEGIKDDISYEKLSSLKPVFTPEGPHTAGNSSQLSDGAAGVILTTYSKAKELGLKPVARLVGYASVDVDSILFPWAPVPAVREILDGFKLDVSDIDLFENNEAFAVSSYIFNKDLKVEYGRLNVHGGSIALGHPLGATGARLLTTLINALKHRGGRKGIASMCHGLGGATAILVELL